MMENTHSEMAQFRQYTCASQAVKDNYYKMRTMHTLEFNIKIRELIKKHEWKVYNIWDIFDKLYEFIDASDPDMNLPNIHHLFQTAEGIRKDGKPDWFQLVGLIHDLGKILFYIIDRDDIGMSIKEQWSIVGDTFVVGCKLPDTCIYPEFNESNIDMNNENLNSDLGIYKEHCGLDNVICSYGHDEYLYQVLRYNKCTIPDEGMYMIRYHSLYPWHSKGEYAHLMNDMDVAMLQHVQEFNKYDLYTKENLESNIDNLKNYYDNLIHKYINEDGSIWL
jgi:inositol oxygenase